MSGPSSSISSWFFPELFSSVVVFSGDFSLESTCSRFSLVSVPVPVPVPVQVVSFFSWDCVELLLISPSDRIRRMMSKTRSSSSAVAVDVVVVVCECGFGI